MRNAGPLFALAAVIGLVAFWRTDKGKAFFRQFMNQLLINSSPQGIATDKAEMNEMVASRMAQPLTDKDFTTTYTDPTDDSDAAELAALEGETFP